MNNTSATYAPCTNPYMPKSPDTGADMRGET